MLQESQRLEEIDGFLVRSELESMGGDHEFSDTPPRRRHRTHIGLRAAFGARAHCRLRNPRLDLGHALLRRLK